VIQQAVDIHKPIAVDGDLCIVEGMTSSQDLKPARQAVTHDGQILNLVFCLQTPAFSF
jgi:hypothetical protein